MTREEAIMTMKEWVKRDSEMKYADRLENIDVYRMAIKALEQEPILDKIKAEIEEMTPTYHNPDWSITDLVPISEVLKLVDKYKAETE